MPEFKALIEDLVSDIGTRIEAFRTIARVVCLFVGPVFLGLALVFGISAIRFLHNCVPADGIIVRFITTTDQANDTVAFTPVFRFAASDGRAYEIRSNSGSNPPRYTVGETVTVLYDPSHPDKARLNSFFSIWGLTLGFAIMGGVATGTGLVLRRYEKWLNRRGLSVTPPASDVPVI